MNFQNIPKEKIIELDARPMLAAGQEPFQAIMKAVAQVPEDGAFRLLVPFSPTPLYKLLENQGWSHSIEKGDGADWIVWFYRTAPSEASSNIIPELEAKFNQFPELKKNLKMSSNTWTLDVRELEPPEPMEMTLSVLAELPKGKNLVQINERVPQFLFPILEDRGFKYIINHEKDRVLIEIQHK